jgi:prepilin-type N-terminal cleavage/methylation domain-containing protein
MLALALSTSLLRCGGNDRAAMRSRLLRVLSASWRGFTLVEVIVALVVMLILATVALPSLTGYLDQKAVEQSATQLATVRDALYNTAAGAIAFRQKVLRNAGRLSQLSAPIVATDPNYVNSCGTQFKAGDVTNWNNNGPFVNFSIDRTTGMASPIGTAADVLTRVPPAAPDGTRLRINFPLSVEIGQAQLLDQTIDTGNGNVAGIVRWDLPAVNGKVNMYYFVPIDATC